MSRRTGGCREEPEDREESEGYRGEPEVENQRLRTRECTLMPSASIGLRYWG